MISTKCIMFAILKKKSTSRIKMKLINIKQNGSLKYNPKL